MSGLIRLGMVSYGPDLARRLHAEIGPEALREDLIDDVLKDLDDRFGDGFPSSGTSLYERFRKAELRLDVEMRIRGQLGEPKGPDDSRARAKNPRRCFKVTQPNVALLDHVVAPGYECLGHVVEGLVFVGVRQAVQQPKRVLFRSSPVLVWLNFKDESPGVARHSLEGAGTAGGRPATIPSLAPEPPTVREDRKGRPSPLGRLVPEVAEPGEFPHQVIEGRAEVVEDVADQRRPPSGWRVKLDDEDHLTLLRVEFLDQPEGGLRVRLASPLDSCVQRLMVEMRPLKLECRPR